MNIILLASVAFYECNTGNHIGHEHGLLLQWLRVASGILPVALIVYGYILNFFRKPGLKT
ncbi:MAG: hypothetical protein R6W78_02415 [Bacteroidales bacterium]